MRQKITQLAQKLRRSKDGSVAAYVGLSIVVLVGAVGISIDAGRGYLVQSKLSSALDAAGLAAASTVNTSNLRTDARKFLDVNFQNYLSSKITDVTITTNSSNTVIGLSAKASLPTTFMTLFGFKQMNIAASSEITRAVSGLELALVLDTTGSMAGTPLTSLKTAANDLLDILFGANSSNDKLWVGIVPFAQAVNIGTSHPTWMDTTYGASLDWGPTSWLGCVDARSGGYDSTDDTAATKKFQAYYWPNDTGANKWIVKGKYQSPLNTTKLGPNLYCSSEVQPLTNNKASLVSKINSLSAVGATHVNLGAVWGWRMLSPKWRGQWGGTMNTNNLPLDYNTPRMNKAVILMTDGENTMYADSVNRSAYGYLSEKRLGSNVIATAEAELNKRLATVCTSMKNNNIIVYTIGFNKPGATISKLLKDCATQPEYYFDSPTGAELQAAFRAIGDSLSNLRVSR
ncbi:pilus assembly protein TadG-related protein [Govanella unica]|uniref:Pilus assembly protein TadG-related protein n=1 Tax=Govanella unica TaxID=2975056 RepID=A0A9X3TY36_9PROT|nr:pilus assembly protein TadG-related protein [Govania unica]MDA5193916.1 pilus assembly protein TadG-related protein [Govania unica]